MWDGEMDRLTWKLGTLNYFDIIFLLMKYEIFLKSKLNLHTSQKLHFQFKDL